VSQPVRTADRREVAVNPPTEWYQRLRGAPMSERAALLESLVAAEFRAWLLIEPHERLPLDESYFELGLTSLGATELQERFEQALGRRIESDSLFNNPTVGHLLAHLRQDVVPELFATAAPTAPPEAPRAPPRDLVNNLLDELYES
jgi:acyl carrier protein